jgi:hypothetical protein
LLLAAVAVAAVQGLMQTSPNSLTLPVVAVAVAVPDLMGAVLVVAVLQMQVATSGVRVVRAVGEHLLLVVEGVVGALIRALLLSQVREVQVEGEVLQAVVVLLLLRTQAVVTVLVVAEVVPVITSLETRL